MREYTDNSGVIDAAQYRCTECGHACLGRSLLPIVRERLKDSDAGIVGTGEFLCTIRRCPQCRGTVAIDLRLHSPCGESPL